MINLTAKDDVGNVGAGRAAKGANPVIRTSKSTNFDKNLSIFPIYANYLYQLKRWQWSIDKEKMYAILWQTNESERVRLFALF